MAEQRVACVEPRVVQMMLAMMPRQTPEDIQEHFGIGINTWRKIRKGEAVRASVVDRLLVRVERQAAG
ncbi:MAG TPA: hypothetical protein PKD92_10575 [Novosphingobium sp.]|nr:hypothetical protein [Novosphingobium sp.]